MFGTTKNTHPMLTNCTYIMDAYVKKQTKLIEIEITNMSSDYDTYFYKQIRHPRFDQYFKSELLYFKYTELNGVYSYYVS
jgi:hypothetical protein